VASAPVVEAATPGLFTTLQTIFQPRVIHYGGGYYWPGLIFGGFGFYIIWRRRSGGSWMSILLFCFCMLLFASMLLPALGTAGVSISSGNVSVIDRKTVGIYETATLSSRNGDALMNWLNQNGFATSTNFVPAIRAYAQEGWFFVASKIRLDQPMNQPAKPHALALTFKTERPVYPLRLTAIGNEKTRIELYVFGPGRAALPNFAVERCAVPSYAAITSEHGPPRLNELRIRHPLLRSLVDQSSTATKLTANLTGARMQQDAYLTWSAFREKQRTVYTRQGAAETAADFSVPVLVLACLLWYSFHGRQTIRAKAFCKICSFALLVTLAAGPVIYLFLPKTPAYIARWPAVYNYSFHTQGIVAALDWELKAMEDKTGGPFKPDLTWVRQLLLETSALRMGFAADFWMNSFTGRPRHEEDSPGNYTLRQTPEGVEYTWYDIDGGAHSFILFGEKKTPVL
jgi:hypothetical protein